MSETTYIINHQALEDLITLTLHLSKKQLDEICRQDKLGVLVDQLVLEIIVAVSDEEKLERTSVVEDYND